VRVIEAPPRGAFKQKKGSMENSALALMDDFSVKVLSDDVDRDVQVRVHCASNHLSNHQEKLNQLIRLYSANRRN
jgi:hypothetical protein